MLGDRAGGKKGTGVAAAPGQRRRRRELAGGGTRAHAPSGQTEQNLGKQRTTVIPETKSPSGIVMVIEKNEENK